MNNFQRDLESLRSGKLSFHTFTLNHRERFYRWSRYFFDRYRPRGIDIDDLVQEALLEAWRAVDSWIPSRSPIDKFVQYRVGERIDREIKRSTGWPKKDRPKKPTILYNVDISNIGVEAVVSSLERLELEEVVSTLELPIERDVTTGVGLGAPIRVVAAYLYDDTNRRSKYKFDNRDQAIKKVRSTVKHVTKKLEAR